MTILNCKSKPESATVEEVTTTEDFSEQVNTIRGFLWAVPSIWMNVCRTHWWWWWCCCLVWHREICPVKRPHNTICCCWWYEKYTSHTHTTSCSLWVFSPCRVCVLLTQARWLGDIWAGAPILCVRYFANCSVERRRRRRNTFLSPHAVKIPHNINRFEVGTLFKYI